MMPVFWFPPCRRGFRPTEYLQKSREPKTIDHIHNLMTNNLVARCVSPIQSYCRQPLELRPFGDRPAMLAVLKR